MTKRQRNIMYYGGHLRKKSYPTKADALQRVLNVEKNKGIHLITYSCKFCPSWHVCKAENAKSY